MMLCTVEASSRRTLFAFLAIELKRRDNNVIILQVRPCGLGSPGLRVKACLTSTVLTCVSAAQRTRLGDADSRGVGSSGPGPKRLEEVLHGGGGEILVVVVVDLNHGGVHAGTEALDLENGEETVGSGLALLNSELLLNSLDDNIRSTASKLARCLLVPLLVGCAFRVFSNLQ